MEKQLEWAHKLGGAEPLGISRVGHTGVSQVDGVSDMALDYWLCSGEGSAKAQWTLLTLMPDTSFSPCTPLVPFKLPSRCWSSEGASQSR